MDVIGIVQTDLNEFNILFTDGNNKQNNEKNQNNNNFFSFLQDDNSSGQSSGNSNGQNQNQYQEMIVRIKGIPEGQKAQFLQMYQIVMDAQSKQDISKQCTVVSDGDGSQGQGQNQG